MHSQLQRRRLGPRRVAVSFPRVATVKQGNRTHRYLQIIEVYRENGRPKHRPVASLSRLDQLGIKLDDLVALLSRDCQSRFVRSNPIRCRQAFAWGPVLLTRHLWEQAGLGEIITKLCRRRRCKFDVAETAFVLVANRLCEPRSEHGLARWLEHTLVWSAKGRRFKPERLPLGQITKDQHVKVKYEQLNRWYYTLDALLAAKEKIEEALYLRVRDLFALKVDVVFYDLTSAYFCGKSPAGRPRRRGHSKAAKPRQVRVLLGVVMANGRPISHHVFAGNTAEKTTLQDVSTDVEQCFGLRRVMLLADRSLVSPDNLEYLSGTKFRHLLGLPGRRCREAVAGLQALNKSNWQRVDEHNFVQEVRLARRSLRYFVIDSAERLAGEQSLRRRSMTRARQALAKLVQAVEHARLKGRVRIGAWAERALKGHRGYRYYSYQVPGRGQFRFYEDGQKSRAETLHESKYILKTDDPQLGGVEAVGAYQELASVESGFRDLKDVIETRPVYHQTDQRIEAHTFVATLALFLKRTPEHQLAQTLSELSSTDALAAMRSIGLAELNLVGPMPRRHGRDNGSSTPQRAGSTLRLVSSSGRDARRVVKALKIANLNPPAVCVRGWGPTDPARQ